MKFDVAGLSVSDVLSMSEAEVRKQGLLEPGKEFTNDRRWWAQTLFDHKCYAKWCPKDELPSEYHVTRDNPNPPLLMYAIPVTFNDIDEYKRKHGWKPSDPKKPSKGSFVMQMLSKHVQYPLRLGYPAPLATEYGVVVVLYTNYTMYEMKLVEEDEEEVISMVKEAVELDEDVRPRWFFDGSDPSVPEYGTNPTE